MPSLLSKIVKFCRKRLSEVCLDRAIRSDGERCARLCDEIGATMTAQAIREGA